MLELLRDSPSLTQPQLMVLMGLGKASVQSNISFLRSNGFIRDNLEKTAHQLPGTFFGSLPNTFDYARAPRIMKGRGSGHENAPFTRTMRSA